ncbi:hypothetical protein DFH09DRAFT_879442, partial [Mycena vulgaris]
ELARYDKEIARLQALLAETISERLAFQAYADGCRSLFSPVRRVPPELLVEVFALLRPSFSSKNNEDKQIAIDRLRNVGVLTVAEVCLRWRTIVIETPMLWSTI